jgi:hypothetical protein
MVASITWIKSLLNFRMNKILICCCHTLCHDFALHSGDETATHTSFSLHLLYTNLLTSVN